MPLGHAAGCDRDRITAARLWRAAARRDVGAASRGRRPSSGRRDSNPRPSPWQGDALPAALRPRRRQQRFRTARRPMTLSDGYCRPPNQSGYPARAASRRLRAAPKAPRPGGPGSSRSLSLRTISSAIARRCSSVACAAIRASRVRSRQAPGREAGQPDLPVGLDHDDRVEPIGQPVLGQQRDVVDDDRPGRRRGRELGRPGAERADARSRSDRRGHARSANTIRASSARSSSPSGPTTTRTESGRPRRRNPACPVRRPRGRARRRRRRSRRVRPADPRRCSCPRRDRRSARTFTAAEAYVQARSA